MRPSPMRRGVRWQPYEPGHECLEDDASGCLVARRPGDKRTEHLVGPVRVSPEGEDILDGVESSERRLDPSPPLERGAGPAAIAELSPLLVESGEDRESIVHGAPP